MITYQQESCGTMLQEAMALMLEHEQEINIDKARVGIALDIPTYLELEEQGHLLIMTARADGKMIGYAVINIRRHSHYDIRCGYEDAHFVSAEFRRGWVGIKLIKETERRLKRLGVRKVVWHVKPHKDTSRLYERLGYVHTDTLFSKWIT